MNKHLPPVIAACILSLPITALSQSPLPELLPPPPQDQGLPYTRSSIGEALKLLGNRAAVMPGSRYGYIAGHRIRLSRTDLLHTEAFERAGKTCVPVEFALLLAPGRKDPAPVPSDLSPIADRWVYAPTEFQPGIPALPASVEIITEKNQQWVAFEDAAAALGLPVTKTKSGIVLAGDPLPADTVGSPAGESLVTLFDTPENFADPAIATRYIPTLRRQGPWTDHVKVSDEQLALLNGPATEWTTVPLDQYDLSGINTALFGSKMPPPGVYPRLFFSPEDLPALRKRIVSTVSGQKTLIEMEEVLGKTWFDPETDDGKLFNQLASGDLDGLEWDIAPGAAPFLAAHTFKGFKPGMYSSHVTYVPECLTAIALYALIKDDTDLGRKAAAAIANYYKLREPLLDAFLEVSDSEFGSSLRMPDGSLADINAQGARTHWRNIHGVVAQQNLAQALDFAGMWMNADEKDALRRFIAKATYGRRSHGQDGPVRFRDVNWMAWDLPHFLAVAAIEGLPGFDPEAFLSGIESARAFCQWGIDPDGVVFETNGKTLGSFQFQLLSMVLTARATGENLFGHPHWRRLLEAQIQMTSPDGQVVVNSGTQYTRHSRQKLSMWFINQFKAFYPGSRMADYLITTELDSGDQNAGVGSVVPDEAFDPAAYRAKVAATRRARLPSASYPGFVRGVLFDADVVPTVRSDLGLPLNFSAPVHGVFSAYSSAEKDAAWINLMVRPNHYLGAGHHHADAGMFHFSALGVNWITESPFTQWYTGNVHNLVTIDGKCIGGLPGTTGILYSAAPTYLGANLDEQAASAGADLTYAYSWRWTTQPPQVWPGDTADAGWEMDPSPAITEIFAGTARMKLRPWWPNYNFGNYIATSRAPFNPVQYVFRTTGLVRGKHPFGFVIDDLKKDDTERLYQWTAMLNGGVWKADLPGLPANAIALATTGQDTDLTQSANRPPISPQPGDPALLVVALGMEAPHDLPLLATETVEGQPDRKGSPQFMDRLVINHRGKEAAFRVLLLPFRVGEPLPKIEGVPAQSLATVLYQNETTDLRFQPDDHKRTKTTIRRDNAIIHEDSLTTPPPGLPRTAGAENQSISRVGH